MCTCVMKMMGLKHFLNLVEFHFFPGFFTFFSFQLNRFRPILYRLIGFIFCRLMSEKTFCLLVCIERNGGIKTFFISFQIFFSLKGLLSGIFGFLTAF